MLNGHISVSIIVHNSSPRASGQLWSLALWEIPCPLKSAGETPSNQLSLHLNSWNLNLSLILGLPIARTIPGRAAELPPQTSRGCLQSQHVCGYLIFESRFILTMALSYCCSIFSWSSGQKPHFWFSSLLQYNFSCSVSHNCVSRQGKHLWASLFLNYSFILFPSGTNKEC